MWKMSQFTVVRSLADRNLPSHNLVFNTRSRKCFTVRAADWANIEAAIKGEDAAGPGVGAAVRQLVRDGFAVGDEVDERRLFAKEFDGIRYNRSRIFPLLTITSACNIGCTYCYEEGIAVARMSDEVVGGVLRWMERRIVDDGIREIHPGLFGGEPLLYPETLFAIMDGLGRLSEQYGIGTSFYCSSNGIKLTPQLAEQLADRGLTQLQISLDGSKDIHNERRVTKGGKPTFEHSLRGLQAAVGVIPNVTVKVNFDRHNRNHIAPVLDRIVAEGWRERVDVKLEAIALQIPGSKVRHPEELVIPPESTEMAETYALLSLECKERGIKVSEDTAHTTPCMMSSDHGVIIGSDGQIYKCISLVGRDEFAVGSVFDDEYDRVEYDKQMDTHKRLDECFEERCAYVPVCAGGCAYESVVRTGHYAKRFCTKPFLTEHHYLRYLMRYREKLETLGMTPLGANERAWEHLPRPDAGLQGLLQLRRRPASGPG